MLSNGIYRKDSTHKGKEKRKKGFEKKPSNQKWVVLSISSIPLVMTLGNSMPLVGDRFKTDEEVSSSLGLIETSAIITHLFIKSEKEESK